MDFELFWLSLGGTMGITALVSVPPAIVGYPAPPAIDFTNATDARFRVRDSSGAVTHLDASIVGTTTATKITIQCIPETGDLVIGAYLVWGEVSLDGGTSWYPTSAPQTLNVVDTGAP